MTITSIAESQRRESCGLSDAVALADLPTVTATSIRRDTAHGFLALFIVAVLIIGFCAL